MKKPTLILAHGSGQPADSPWMLQLSAALEAHEIEVVRFNFNYMALAQQSGKPRPPSRLPALLEEFQKIVGECSGQPFVGGKSLGGRVASHLASQDGGLPGVVAFGYPFHPPGKPEKLRTDHLPNLKCPMLICQGERDPFGKRAEVESYDLPSQVEICWLCDGDHQLKPLKRSAATLESNLAAAAQRAASFMKKLAVD